MALQLFSTLFHTSKKRHNRTTHNNNAIAKHAEKTSIDSAYTIVNSADYNHAESERVQRIIEHIGSTLPLPMVQRALGMLEGNHQSNRAGNGHDFFDLRDYTSSDEIRMIHWSASARVGHPIVTIREHEANTTLTIILDNHDIMATSTTRGEQTLQVAHNVVRMFASLCAKRGDELRLVTTHNNVSTSMSCNSNYGIIQSTLRSLYVPKMLQQHHRAKDPANSNTSYTSPYSTVPLRTLVDSAQLYNQSGDVAVIITHIERCTNEFIKFLQRYTQRQHVIVVAIQSAVPANPDTNIAEHDIISGKQMPYMLKNEVIHHDIATHYAYMDSAIRKTCERYHATYISIRNSQDIVRTLYKALQHPYSGTRHSSMTVSDSAMNLEAWEKSILPVEDTGTSNISDTLADITRRES